MNDVSKFGFRLGCGASWEPVWPGGTTYPFPAAAETIRVKAGGNAADDAAGTGARTIRVEGLDANFEPISEDLTLAGASASAATTATFLRVFRAYLLTAGSGEVNAGIVNIENTSTLAVLAVIPAGYGQTKQAIWTVPAGYRAKLQRGRFYVDGAQSADFRFVLRTGIDGATPVRRVTFSAFGVSGGDDPQIMYGDEIVGPADVWLEAQGGATPNVVGRFEGDVVKRA